MIVESQYPTRFQIPGIGTSSSDPKMAECTDNFGSTYQGQTVDSVDSYFLGYISSVDMPRAYGSTAVYKDDDGNIIFEEITAKNNFPCGYCYCYSNYYEVNQNLYTVLNGTKTITSNLQVRLYNNNYPMYSGRATWTNMSSYLDLQFAWILFDAGGTALANQVSSYSYSFINTKESYDFLKGNKRLTLNLGTYGTSTISVKIDAENIAEGKAYLPVEGTNYFVRIAIIGFDNNNGVYAISYSSPPAVYPRFMVKTYGEYAGTSIERVSCGSSPNSTAYSWFTKNHIDSAAPTKDNPLFMYNLAMSGKFDDRGFQNISNSKFYFDGNMCFMVTNNGIDAYPVFSIEEISKAFCLAYRGDTTLNGHTAGYVKDVTYATDVNSDNRFLAKWKTGNLEDAAFKNGLREWQWNDDPEDGGFKTDDYKEEDIPDFDPRPDPEDPGDEETSGDDLKLNDPSGLGNGFGFTTMYAIRSSHLEEIGAKLWSGFTDLDHYLENFTFDVNPDTGSVNFADVMSFFISLRAYPCPISTMASTSGGGTDMYIGSGAVPMSLTTPFSIVNSCIGQIDAGSVKIPYWYGDYRDYELQIIAYLPYCGTMMLNPGDVMGGTLHAKYVVDFCSGACMAYVWCETWEGATILVGSLPGQLGADIPMTATNAGQVMARMYSDRINVAQNILNGVKSIGSIATGTIGGAIQGVTGVLDASMESERHFANMGSRGAISSPMLSGGRGLASLGTSITAYVQVRSPYYTEPSRYGHTAGKPAVHYGTLSSFSGYTECYNVDVSGIHCTEEERAAIKTILETGCYL